MKTDSEEECRIGVSGHRILTDVDRLRAGIGLALERIQHAYPGKHLTLYSSLAEGADQLVAEAVLSHPNGRLVAVLPLTADDYAQTFTTPESLASFGRLLARSGEVLMLPPVLTRDQAYENAGNLILARCDVLLAVWDGQASQGQGGTGQIVEAARSLGRPVVIVRAGNRLPGTHEPTSLGDTQGQVLAEQLPQGQLMTHVSQNIV